MELLKKKKCKILKLVNYLVFTLTLYYMKLSQLITYTSKSSLWAK